MVLVQEKSKDFPAPPPTNVKEWRFGIPDQEFYQRTPEKGLITKMEVRVISLSKMNIHPESVVWDIGAGSGSVSIESALLAPQGKVIAMEKNSDDVALIRKNIEKFKTPHVDVIHGTAPDCLSLDLPSPNAVFIGGTAGNMFEILNICSGRLKSGGRIVINLITIENLAEAWSSLKKLQLKSDATVLQVSRSQPILEMNRFAALNPIFILTATKGENS
ncbi:MAG: precorrin-6Y C5,15-methyltransferase (decarboxylating) subunit CbiT [Elusimicrobia bacterium]|nr:precorrin-6Y C5,15-methyltransferase (decarboxylating) subunit CbiT [Elusimicrobiota bacterium]